jgi:putative heme-binding domain-containing protein
MNAFGQSGLKPAERAKLFNPELRDLLAKMSGEDTPSRVPAILLSLWWDDPRALTAARAIVADPNADIAARSELLKALAERKDPSNIVSFKAFVNDQNAPLRLRKEAVDALGAANDSEAASALTSAYAKQPAELKPAIVNALTRTKASAEKLLDAIESKSIPAGDVTANHVRQIHALGDKELAQRVTKLWGAVKTERDPERVKIVQRMRESLRKHKGSAVAGQAVFTKNCASCHVIYGQGGNVGPDITGVGRENLDAILANVLDPNLVIGAGYFVNVARLKNGTVVSGLLVEQSDTQVVLKDATKTYTLNRAEIDRLKQQDISMMPEGLEQGMSEQEFADLVAFLLTREMPSP